MIGTRGCIVLAALALFAAFLSQSHAEEQKPSIHLRHMSPGRPACTVVRDFVALVGPDKAEQMARDAGASDARITAARRCIKETR